MTPPDSHTPIILTIFSILCLAYIGIAASVYFYQRHLLYRPTTSLAPPSDYHVSDMQVISLSSTDNVTLTAWYCAPSADKKMPLLIYFHGNTGNIGDRSNKLRHFKEAGFGILAISYRGYGTSGGHPTEQGIYADARAAMAYAQQQHIPLNQVVLYGESLGSGVAVQMATEFPVQALILEAPYTSLTDLAHLRFPFIPTSVLLKDHFNSAAKIQQIHTPLLVMHGDQDATIPIRFGKALLALANEPKQGVFFPAYHHTDFDPAILTDTMKRFLEKFEAK